MLAAGYRRTTRHNFVKQGFEYRYERMIAELRPLIGLGANSISYAKDCIYRNHSDLALYESSIRKSQLPVRSGHLFEPIEQPHNYAVRQIEYLSLSGEDFEQKFGLKLRSVLKTEIDILEEFGLAHMIEKDLILTDDGIYYTSAIKRVLFHESAWNRLQEMSNEDFSIERGLFASTTAAL
jgi:coproporphyrinogen III oxidase-like Fe-S oxidoreductase